nr:hypothetical protein [Tanacetum cinerariifolium]
MVEKSKLDEDKEGKAVDPSHYHAFVDTDHAGCQDTRRSTSGSVQFLGERLISWTMDTTTDQQVAMDEALVPHAKRLRIGRRNFHLLSNIKSKESTLQLVYDILRIRAAPPKPKASVRKTRNSFDTTITPPTAAAGLRLTTSEKGKQATKASKAKSLSALSEVAMIEAQQLKLVTKRSLQQTHISQASGSSADEGTGSIPGVPDVPTDKSEEELSWNSTDEEGDDDEGKDGDGDDDDNGDDGDGDDEDNDGEEGNDDDDQEDERDDGEDDEEDEGGDDEQPSDEEDFIHAEEEPRDEESFDPILKTPEDTDDEGNGKEELGLNSDKLREEAQKENDEFLKTIDDNMQKIIKEQVKEQVKTSYVVAADLSEMELKKILIEKMEGNKSIHRSNEQRNLYKALIETYKSDKIILDTYEDTVTLKRRHDDDADKDKEPSAGPDRGSKRRREGKEPESAKQPMQTTFEMEEPAHPGFETAIHGSIQPWISDLAKQSDSRSSFNELMDTPVDFSNFLINRLNVDTLTPELLAGPTYELLKGSCKSLVELEYHLKEVYKATIDQLDWVNPEGQQYPHNLLKPLPLIPNNQGHRVIPFDHFINNDLEYLRGGASSRKYTTSVTKTKWHNYKHLDWITVRRDDDKLYKFKEVEERFAFNVSLRMFTRSIVIQRRVEDLQLGVESYQKRIHLPDTYQEQLMRIDELHKFNDGTLTDVRTALDDRLKWIQMQYLPQSIWRKSDKDRAAAMIQAIDKRLKIRRIMRSLERSILTDLQVTSTKPEQMTKPYSSHRFIANCFNAGNLKMEVKVPGSSYLIDS